MNKFKKNQWVIIPDGRVGKIVAAYDDDYFIEVNNIRLDFSYNSSQLKPAPKTFRTIEVGDIIVNKDGDEAKVLEVGENGFLRSLFGYFEEVGSYFLFQEAERKDWTIKGAEEPKEVSMDEIAKAMNIPVEKLKIKKEK